jgi:hypothetical protein
MSVHPGRRSGRAARRNRWKKRDRSTTPKPGTLLPAFIVDFEWTGWRQSQTSISVKGDFFDRRRRVMVEIRINAQDIALAGSVNQRADLLKAQIESASASLIDFVYRHEPTPILAQRRRISARERFQIATTDAVKVDFKSIMDTMPVTHWNVSRRDEIDHVVESAFNST